MFISSLFIYSVLQNNTSVTRRSENHCMLLETLNEQQDCKKQLDLSDPSLSTDGPLTPAMESQTATRL